MTCAPPPGEATHWTGRAMAKAAGISLRSVQHIWDAHRLRPHRVRPFKRSRDPQFTKKLVDVAGLYLNPPERAVVLSIDEKSQIQALDRTQPGRPLRADDARLQAPRYHHAVKPLIWTVSAASIMAKLQRLRAASV